MEYAYEKEYSNREYSSTRTGIIPTGNNPSEYKRTKENIYVKHTNIMYRKERKELKQNER